MSEFEQDLAHLLSGETLPRQFAAVRYRRVLEAFSGSPWAILPEKLAQIRSILMARMEGLKLTAEEIAAARREAPAATNKGRVALVPIFGTISQRPSLFASGGTSTETVGRQIDALANDRDIRAIVLQIDSPGGSVFGVPELATKIREAREQKKVIAQVDSMAASAAYWLAAQASEIAITPGGQAGSIGVFMAHEDVSALLANEGVKTTLISAGKYKVEGNPFEPLSDDARAALQASVDRYYSMFVDDVAAGRGVKTSKVKSGFGEGRMVGATEAVREGMADRVSTLEQTLRKLGAAGTVAPARARRELELAEAD